MAPPAGLGDLGLWLHLRSRAGGRLRNLQLPPGNGPLLLMRTSPDAAAAATQVEQALLSAAPDLRIMAMGRDGLPDIGDDPLAAPQLLKEARPFAVLLLGDDLPPALIAAAGRAGLPVVLGQARISGQRRGMGAAIQRRLLGNLHHLLLTDAASAETARAQSVPPDRLRLTGPVTTIREPLSCVEAERAVLAAMLHRRHVWLAAATPQSEEAAVIAAHRAALRNAHRSLLILTPADRQRTAALAAELDAAGLVVALRSEDQDPSDDIQILLADDPQEMGLWYRLAPVTYMGGTLTPGGSPDSARHPFEPASLGSAIIHGPEVAPFSAEWRQLDDANATRVVADDGALAASVADLSHPDQIAQLAANAWSVSTGGAGVALQIAEAVLANMPKALA